ncbi:MAG: hypothetical protein LQ339_000915 [Xanthoria mediterranea]|nr:MAG: hypothetical protein LQ339_000915 [Xanthoria mediterranea]
MPVGIQRLNAHQSQPNDRIIFIKPLPGPTASFAEDFLSRIAAICKPIMAAAHLSVMTLEEYEPNPEFVGRNFNAGEIIQLVLKAPRTGHWLSFRSVQMVMMHELAHCLQMNHGREFWKVRNQYAGELRELWAKGYTGDGFWGRGKTVLSERYEHQGSWEEEVMPERLCGGTFRTRRGRKRKRGVKTEELSYAERQQRRIERKFGRNGQQLGGEEEIRVKLEKGKKPKGQPRVAGSARGRELRAAAALARFGTLKEKEVKKEEAIGASDSDSGSDFEDVKPEKEALDLNGSKLLDGRGRGMVKVCEDEDEDDVHVKQEMDELHDLSITPVESHGKATPPSRTRDTNLKRKTDSPSKSPMRDNDSIPVTIKHEETPPPLAIEPKHLNLDRSTLEESAITPLGSSCPVCSMANEPSALVCVACSHVLQPRLMPGTWRCQSSICQGSKYLNIGDCGLCGVCGSSKPIASG